MTSFTGFGENIDNLQNIDNTVENETVETTSIDVPSYEDAKTPTLAKDIRVNVIDKKTPIVMLFGAPQSGKTMTLVRLCRYLHSQGYQITIDRNFCTTAWEYEVNSDNFNDKLNTYEQLPGTNHNDFLFVIISDKTGRPVCQILEAAGEDYFSIESSRVDGFFTGYMQTVFNAENKKIWAFITEPNWKDVATRNKYVSRIQACKNQSVNKKDKFIVLYNKVDKIPQILQGQGKVNEQAAHDLCHNEYQNIFDIFTENGILGRTKKYKFIPFTTGSYDQDGCYTPSINAYPEKLWNVIQQYIKPSLF